MNNKYINKQDLEKELETLPEGNIVTKNINGKDYYYLRINKNNKRTEKFIPFDNVDELVKLIQRRKNIKAILKEEVNYKVSRHTFKTYVIRGNELKALVKNVSNYKKRECYKDIQNYIYNEKYFDKVLILYGLRRTGKTTLIRQIINDMNDDAFNTTAFIQIKPNNTLSDINKDLKYLQSKGYRYIFIDEVTMLNDFIEGAALFSDIFASSGLKIVLSGTDSLGFMFTKTNQLYDRAIFIHTTFISYREFEYVLGIKGIDEYIKYSGTMSISGNNYNDEDCIDEYIDSSIAKNIQHSLKNYDNSSHFGHLLELYENNELTNTINRIVEDINHRFTIDTLTKTFKSNDLSLSIRNLIKDKDYPIDLNDHLDIDKVTNDLKEMLEILNKNEQSIDIKHEHIIQIYEYLKLLDLIIDVDLVIAPVFNKNKTINIITQSGLRFHQAKALIESMMNDDKFIELSLIQRTRIIDRILNEIKGRMMEEIILLETKVAHKNKNVFKLQFPVGEFDMVIFDKDNLSCEIFEIKHSKEVNPQQYRHLIDEEKCHITAHYYGSITSKNVIYRGDNKIINGINYINVEDYLKNILK